VTHVPSMARPWDLSNPPLFKLNGPRDGPAHWQQLQQFGIDYFKIICVSHPTFDWFLDIRNVLCFTLPVPK
jgi:hypothetical protein